MKELVLSPVQARRIWLHAQGLDTPAPFGSGAAATALAVAHLGYVQIDTISVIERCHHHILFSRIPDYHRRHLHQSQTVDKTVFEYWTHALSYVPTKDFRFYRRAMNERRRSPGEFFKPVKSSEMNAIVRLIKKSGPLSIRDIKDDVLVEKAHLWASRKPSKRVLQLGFHTGRLVISERQGMLKKYELIDRHFDWDQPPTAASEAEVLGYLLARSLRAQGLVSLDSICHLNAKSKPGVRKLIDGQVKRGELVPVRFNKGARTEYWARSEAVAFKLEAGAFKANLLSPFDPLIIQRKRLKEFFGYDHRFEAYIPKPQRIFGYFALPVLLGDQIVAAVDLKTDRQQRKLVMQKWTWIGKGKSAANKVAIEEALGRFEKFQLAAD